jgi:outer membrane protein TolC
MKYAESALNGVRDEARVGQCTTLDVLNAIQALNARVSLITAQHDRVVASYNLLPRLGACQRLLCDCGFSSMIRKRFVRRAIS